MVTPIKRKQQHGKPEYKWLWTCTRLSASRSVQEAQLKLKCKHFQMHWSAFVQGSVSGWGLCQGSHVGRAGSSSTSTTVETRKNSFRTWKVASSLWTVTSSVGVSCSRLWWGAGSGGRKWRLYSFYTPLALYVIVFYSSTVGAAGLLETNKDLKQQNESLQVLCLLMTE